MLGSLGCSLIYYYLLRKNSIESDKKERTTNTHTGIFAITKELNKSNTVLTYCSRQGQREEAEWSCTPQPRSRRPSWSRQLTLHVGCMTFRVTDVHVAMDACRSSDRCVCAHGTNNQKQIHAKARLTEYNHDQEVHVGCTPKLHK